MHHSILDFRSVDKKVHARQLTAPLSHMRMKLTHEQMLSVSQLEEQCTFSCSNLASAEGASYRLLSHGIAVYKMLMYSSSKAKHSCLISKLCIFCMQLSSGKPLAVVFSNICSGTLNGPVLFICSYCRVGNCCRY